ncbi:MAG: hypothetical protein ABSD41_08510 [Candidatus Bathyarchaeia archaeon]|jgi:hypothetical protein
MDMQAIARRIAQDHGVTVLEKDVIETLEKLKAENKDKITGAGETQVPPVTGADDTQKVPAPLTAPLSTGASTTTAPVKTVPAPLQTDSAQANPAPAPLPTGSAPLQTTTGAPSAPLPIGSGASSAPLPADLPSIVAAFQQFLAAYKQAPNTIPTASEQPNESDSIYDVDNNRRVLRV